MTHEKDHLEIQILKDDIKEIKKDVKTLLTFKTQVMVMVTLMSALASGLWAWIIR